MASNGYYREYDEETDARRNAHERIDSAGYSGDGADDLMKAVAGSAWSAQPPVDGEAAKRVLAETPADDYELDDEEYNLDLDRRTAARPPEYNPDDYRFMDIDYKCGFPIWLDDDSLNFLLSIRYNSPAFAGSYVQDEYRMQTHKVFTGVVTQLITNKIEMMREYPQLFRSEHAHVVNPDTLSELSRDNILQVAKRLGIDPTQIDTTAVVSDVTVSLQNILTDFIRKRPGMSKSEKDFAINFLDDQLWDPQSQVLWRNVSSTMLGKLYEYENLPDSVYLMSILDDYVRNEFLHGQFQGMTPEDTDLAFILSDEAIRRISDIRNSPELKGIPREWAIRQAIAVAQDDGGTDDGLYEGMDD